MSDDRSNRLRNRSTDTIDRTRGQSTRLRDRADSDFQQRRQRQQQTRSAIDDARGEFASALDLDEDLIEPVQLDQRGESFGFVPGDRGADILAERFADEREFVEPGDAEVDADPRRGVETRVRRDRKDDVRERAAVEFAGEDEFTEPDDLEVQVGRGGVEQIDVTDRGQRRRAGRQFESQFETFGPGDLDPDRDIRQTDDGFGLERQPAKRAAAEQFDAEFPDIDITTSDVTLEERSDGSFDASFEVTR